MIAPHAFSLFILAHRIEHIGIANTAFTFSLHLGYTILACLGSTALIYMHAWEHRYGCLKNA
jgi:hypothetical protein